MSSDVAGHSALDTEQCGHTQPDNDDDHRTTTHGKTFDKVLSGDHSMAATDLPSA